MKNLINTNDTQSTPIVPMLTNSAYSQTNIIPFGLCMAKAKGIHQSLSSKIKLADSTDSLKRVLKFINTNYQNYFPSIEVESGQHYNSNSFVFYSEDVQGNITSTVTIMVDSIHGFSEEELFKQDIQSYRQQGLNCLQIGRFIISQQQDPQQTVTVKDYFRLFYSFSKQLGFDVIIGLIKQKDIAFHQKLLGAKLLCSDTGINYGSNHTFAVAAWQLDSLKPRFFRWIELSPSESSTTKTIYQPSEWQNYAHSFAAVQTNFQRELQLSAASLLYGDVADFGCGSAKLAPLLADNTNISSYTGIDYCSEMIKIADWLIAQFECPTFSTFEGKIEHYNGKMFDSAVSLNSYYTWPEPRKVLHHIHSLLNNNGLFVLATPNPQLNMAAMEKEARKELLTHPNFDTFRQINLTLTENTEAHFIEMNELITQLQTIGFAIISCHQSFYLGGLNFIVSKKIALTS